MAFFKNLFKTPTNEETLEKITKLQQQQKLLGLEEAVSSKHENLQQRVKGLRRKKFGRSLAGKAVKGFVKLGAGAIRGSGKNVDLFGSGGDVDLFGSPGPKKKSKKKSSEDDFGIDLGF